MSSIKGNTVVTENKHIEKIKDRTGTVKIECSIEIACSEDIIERLKRKNMHGIDLLSMIVSTEELHFRQVHIMVGSLISKMKFKSMKIEKYDESQKTKNPIQ